MQRLESGTGVSGQSRGAIMKKQDKVPCQDCQKVFHGHATLTYLYCGHHRVIVFRDTSGAAEFVPVQSTEEAMQIIMQSGHAPVSVARSA